MAILNGQKQMLINQVKNSSQIEVSTLVELIKKYDDLNIEDFKGVISDLLYSELIEAGRDANEVALWQQITNASQETPEEVQKLQRMLVQYQSQYPNAPMCVEAGRMVTILQQKMQKLVAEQTKRAAIQREENDWLNLEKGNYNSLHLYKQKYPESAHRDELDDLMWSNTTIVLSLHNLNRYLADWPEGKHASEARQALGEIAQWEQVKRSRDIFKVDDYRDNHPDSVFKFEIDSLYYELRSEVLANMKKNPTEYDKNDVDNFIAADIFSLYDFFDNELMTDESWEVLCTGRDNYPDIAEYQIENPNLKAPENCTDIYLLGTPGTGKTCLLMGLSGANGKGYTLNMKVQGGAYASALQQYVNAGITPGRTYGKFVTVINGEVNEEDKRGNVTNHPINLVEMSGEEFALRIADSKDVTLANMGTGATNLLMNQNPKVFFIVIDPTRPKVKVGYRYEVKDSAGVVTGYEIRNKYVSQLDIMNKFVSLFKLPENAEIMKRVDAIHFIVTKADTLGDTDAERRERAKELLLSTYIGPVESLKSFCRQTKRINYSTDYKPHVFTFSLGNFFLGDVFNFNDTETLQIVDSIRAITMGKTEETWWHKVKKIFN